MGKHLFKISLCAFLLLFANLASGDLRQRRTHRAVAKSAATAASCTPPVNTTEGIALGRFRFFPNRQELRLGDASPRLLSHRETELLALLASPPNSNVTRKDILDKLWGNDSFFNSRNLDMYVSKLREDASVQLLTLKGVGYRLVY